MYGKTNLYITIFKNSYSQFNLKYLHFDFDMTSKNICDVGIYYYLKIMI